jgi:predicted small lipoprotein YifL
LFAFCAGEFQLATFKRIIRFSSPSAIMEKLKWIYFVVLFEHLSGTASQGSGGPLVFPDSDENVGK